MLVLKKMHGSGKTVIFSNEEINDMIKVVKALEDSDILVKGVTKALQNDVKKGGALPILPMLLGTLVSSLLGNLLSGRGLFRSDEGMCRAGKGLYRTGQGIKKALILPKPHPLTNIEIINYYKDEPRFNGVYSRDNLPKTIQNGAYVINPDEYADVGTHWIVLYVKNNKLNYFDFLYFSNYQKLVAIKLSM